MPKLRVAKIKGFTVTNQSNMSCFALSFNSHWPEGSPWVLLILWHYLELTVNLQLIYLLRHGTAAAVCASKLKKCTSAKQLRAHRLRPTSSFIWTNIMLSSKRCRWLSRRRQAHSSSRASSSNESKSVHGCLCLTPVCISIISTVYILWCNC